MNKKYYILFLSLFLLLAHSGFGQENPWRFRKTGVNHTLIIDTTTVINITDFSGSGVLGVFYDSLGIDVCAGYSELNRNSEYLIAYGQADNLGGINAGDRFKFKVWDREKDCIYDNVEVAYNQTDKIPNEDIFTSDGVSQITSIKGAPQQLDYAKRVICQNYTPFKIILDSGKYTYNFASADGLKIDHTTGLVDPANSIPGEYTVKVSSNYCISNPTYSVLVSSSELEIPELKYKCPDENIDLSSISGEGTDSWEVIDTIDVSAPLGNGVHILSFVNSDGCIVEKQITILDFPEQEVQFEADYNCESTTIRLANDIDFSSVEWPNNTTGNSIEVFENTDIEVRYTDSNQCNRSQNIDVEIKKLEIKSLETRVIAADCYVKGGIEISNINVENRIGDLEYEFVNLLTEEKFYSSSQLTEGKYQIHVFDERNCIDTWQQEIMVNKDCLKDRPVFSPNNDYVDDKYYISEPGMAEIFNRNGTKLAEFETPIYWDGTNQQGQKLPMGTYLIVINKKKVTNITILR